MGLISSIVTGRPISATYAPIDNFWYQTDPRGSRTASGYAVTPESALRLGAVFACVGLISDMIGALPLLVYRKQDDGGKERATTNPLFSLLHRQPNQRQTSKEWRSMGAAHLLLRGNFYNEIVLDRRFAVSELRPLHPDRVTVTLLDSGRRGYTYRAPSGPPRAFTQDEIFHVMGFTLDGVVGCSVVEYARESISTALLQEGYAGRFWNEGGEPRSLLMRDTPGPAMSKETKEDLQRAWRERGNKLAIIEGLKYQAVGMTGRDAQYVESRKFSVSDIARFFRVPPHMIGDVDGSTSWGTGIEQQTIGFVNFTLLPWLVAFEQAIDRDLILDERHFAEFLVDALLRGDMAARASAYSTYVMNGIMSENEVRLRENMNPSPGLNEPQRSINQGRSLPVREQIDALGGLIRAGYDPQDSLRVVGLPRIRHTGNPPVTIQPEEGSPQRGVAPPPPPQRDEPAPPPRRPADDDEDEAASAADAEWSRTHAAAVRLVHREVAAIRKWAPRYTGNAAGWRKWTSDFYGRYVGQLERDLAMPQATARAYCANNCALIVENHGEISDEYEQNQPGALAALVLEGERGAEGD